jgi:hypothetical protein
VTCRAIASGQPRTSAHPLRHRDYESRGLLRPTVRSAGHQRGPGPIASVSKRSPSRISALTASRSCSSIKTQRELSPLGLPPPAFELEDQRDATRWPPPSRPLTAFRHRGRCEGHRKARRRFSNFAKVARFFVRNLFCVHLNDCNTFLKRHLRMRGFAK